MSFRDTKNSANNLTGALLALAGMATFSTQDVIVKYLGATYSPAQIIFFASLLGFPIITALQIGRRSSESLWPRHPWWVLLRSVSIIGSSFCAFYAFSVLPLAQTYAFLFLAPGVVTLLAIPVLGEHVGVRRILAVVVGFAGVLVALQPGTGTSELSLGHLAVFFAVLANAVVVLVTRKIGSRENSWVLLLWPMVGSMVFMGGVMMPDYQPMPLVDLGWMAMVAVLNLAATRLVVAAYRAGEATIVTPMQYSQIIWAVLYGSIFFAELPSQATWIGMSLIVGSGVYILLRESRFRSRALLAGQPRPAEFLQPSPPGEATGLPTRSDRE